jgi:hypothetical protein
MNAIPARLTTNLEKRLLAYAASATITAMASSLPADAEIVYTPAHQTISIGYDAYNLDLNRDGITDFQFVHISTCTSICVSYIDVVGALSTNQIVGGGPPSSFASALPRGAHIGSDRKFDHFGQMAYAESFFGSVNWRGPWANGGKGVTNRYLGLKFKIDNETHYGWARLTVTTDFDHITALLTGYAYETEADRPIEAGILPVSNPDTVSEPNMTGQDGTTAGRERDLQISGTLGVLARGAAR